MALFTARRLYTRHTVATNMATMAPAAAARIAATRFAAALYGAFCSPFALRACACARVTAARRTTRWHGARRASAMM